MHRSLYSNLAGQELSWMAMDSIEFYSKHLESRYHELEANNWLNASFTYKLNSYGFRCAEFTDAEPSVMFLGCSHTFGVGLPLEKTWAHLVSTEIKLKNYNLGMPGCSNDTAFRLAYYWLDKIKPKLVILCRPEITRIELLDEETLIRFNVDTLRNNVVPPELRAFYKKWIFTDLNSEMNAAKNVLAITQLCNTAGIELKIINADYFMTSRVDLARDLFHAGVATNKNFADVLLTQISSPMSSG